MALAACCLLPSAAQAAGIPTQIQVSLSPPTILADGAATTVATATETDDLGQPLAGQTVSFSSTDPGQSFGSVRDNGDGTYSVQITASTTVGSSTITASDTSVPTVTGSATLTQTAGPPARVTVSAPQPPSIVADGVSKTTATATVTDAYGHPLPSESVTFTSSDPGQSLHNYTNHNNGTYSVQITASKTVGASTITATDGAASGQATLTQTAGPAAQIALTLNPPTIAADAQSTTSATAAVTDAQGHPLPSENVKFASTDKGQFIGPVTVNGDGTYTVQIRGSRTVGSSTITATDGSATGQATLIQAAGPSATSLFASTSSPVTNQPVTLVATVNGGAGAPSGTITFENGGAAIAGCAGEPVSPLSTVATCQTSFAAAGSPVPLTAVFVPGAGSTAPGSTGSLSLGVQPDSTSVAVFTPGSALAGRPSTYTAVVAPPSTRPGPVQPSGTVAFFDNGNPIASCNAQPLVHSTGTCTVLYKSVGTHSITASYGGDANFTGSTSPPSSVALALAPRLIRGTLDPAMLWTFHFKRSYTTVGLLTVTGTSAGDTVTVTCHGHGCPFARRVKRIAKVTSHKRCGRGSRVHKCAVAQGVDITAALRSHRLRAGATIAVAITRPDWIGKYYIFRIRAGRAPRIGISCLAPGFAKPGVACKA